MSEPITLYRDGDELTVYAPSWAKQLQAEGWTLEPDDVPFSFHDEYDSTVRNPPFVEDEPAPAPEPAPKPRRGRKPKGKA